MFQPLRVVHVALQLETGGMERLLTEFARHADRSRFALSFIALGTRGRMADEIESCGWPVTALNIPQGLRPSVGFQLARMFQAEQIDVVHTHNTKPLLYAGPAARLAGVAGVIHTRHGQRHGASRRQNIAFALASRCADRLVCVSNDSARLCHGGGINSESVRTIPNGIDLDKFQFAGPAVNGPALYVGRLSSEKDVATLLRATAIVIRECPRFSLQIAGDGRCRAELDALANSLKIADRVEFLGDVQNVGELMRRASSFVLPSLTEGIPLTVLEAMATGLPVVATAVGGTPEAVVDGATGLLVPSGDPARLATALLQIIQDPTSAREFGIAGRARVESCFDVRRMVAGYESLYSEIASRRLRRAA